MEFDTSELYELGDDLIDDIKPYLKENVDVFLMMYNDNVI
jgi:translation elongation factor P/translation initiation factor 5A